MPTKLLKCHLEDSYKPINLGKIKFIPDERVPDNEIWACNDGVVEQILDLKTNKIEKPKSPIFVTNN